MLLRPTPKCAAHLKVWCAGAEAMWEFSPPSGGRPNQRKGAHNSWLPKPRYQDESLLRTPEIGMGVETAYAQIVAEELDVTVDHVDFVLGDTARTANQGGVGGSTSIMMGAKPLRNAAANARYLLTQLASSRLGAPPEQLQVKDGIVSVMGDASKKISYADLASAGELNDALKVSGEGFGLNVEGAGKPKDPSTYTIVGKSAPRVDLPPKILGKYKYVTDVRVEGMLHGRVIRPSGVGATLVSVDENSAKAIPGYVKVVVNGNFVGVVAENEWAAVQAAKALKVTWTAPK